MMYGTVLYAASWVPEHMPRSGPGATSAREPFEGLEVPFHWDFAPPVDKCPLEKVYQGTYVIDVLT